MKTVLKYLKNYGQSTLTISGCKSTRNTRTPLRKNGMKKIQNYTNDHHYDYNHGSILVNGTNLPSILAEHLDAVTSIENFDPMSKPNITVIDLKTQMKKTKEKRASGLDGIKPDLLKIIGEDEYCLRVMVNPIRSGLFQTVNDPGGGGGGLGL